MSGHQPPLGPFGAVVTITTVRASSRGAQFSTFTELARPQDSMEPPELDVGAHRRTGGTKRAWRRRPALQCGPARPAMAHRRKAPGSLPGREAWQDCHRRTGIGPRFWCRLTYRWVPPAQLPGVDSERFA
jgi:hypothetical protein